VLPFKPPDNAGLTAQEMRKISKKVVWLAHSLKIMGDNCFHAFLEPAAWLWASRFSCPCLSFSWFVCYPFRLEAFGDRNYRVCMVPGMLEPEAAACHCGVHNAVEAGWTWALVSSFPVRKGTRTVIGRCVRCCDFSPLLPLLESCFSSFVLGPPGRWPMKMTVSMAGGLVIKYWCNWGSYMYVKDRKPYSSLFSTLSVIVEISRMSHSVLLCFVCTGRCPRAWESKVSRLESESPAFCSDRDS